MRKFFAIIIVAIISLIHVHLNMFTVENPLNPTFWIYLLYETSPVDGIAFDYISRFAIMGINSLVTAVIASKLLYWNKKGIWLFSLIIVSPVLLYYPKTNDDRSFFSEIYSNYYHYDALPYVIRYSSTQILLILSYYIFKGDQEGLLDHGDF